jgi:hypothetical protein
MTISAAATSTHCRHSEAEYAPVVRQQLEARNLSSDERGLTLLRRAMGKTQPEGEAGRLEVTFQVRKVGDLGRQHGGFDSPVVGSRPFCQTFLVTTKRLALSYEARCEWARSHGSHRSRI